MDSIAWQGIHLHSSPTKISLPRVRLAFRMLEGKIADGPAGQMRGRRLGVNYEYDSEN